MHGFDMDSIGQIIKTQKLLLNALVMALIGFVTPSFASNPVSGQLVVINGVANIVNGSLGSTASPIKIEVKDSTGICSTTSSVAYGGLVTVRWAASNTHGANSCTNIASVDVTALKTSMGTVQYDSTANSTPPVTATAPTTFTAPTTPITNLALIVTGSASPATVNSATVWGSALGVMPVYDLNNGSIVTTGIMGSVGSSGLKAEAVMYRHAVLPALDRD